MSTSPPVLAMEIISARDSSFSAASIAAAASSSAVRSNGMLVTSTVSPLAAAPALDSGTSELRMAASDEIAALVEKQPEEVAQLLRGWLVEADH